MSADKTVQSRPRWRVAIVDDHERSRSALRAAIWAAGGEVVGEAVRCADALAVVRRAASDVAICAAGLPDGDGVQTAALLTANDVPVVLFTSHTDEALVERARGRDHGLPAQAAASRGAGARARSRHRAVRRNAAAQADARAPQGDR